MSYPSFTITAHRTTSGWFAEVRRSDGTLMEQVAAKTYTEAVKLAAERFSKTAGI